MISAFDMATAHFTYKGPANIEKPSFTTFTFLGSDDGDISNGGANTDTTPHTVTVHINPVNDAPAAKTTTVTTTLSDYTFKTTDFVATTAAQFDPNDFGANKGSPVHAAGTGDNFTGIFITTLPQSGVLNDKGVPVKAGDFIPAADISGNQLTFTPGCRPGQRPLHQLPVPGQGRRRHRQRWCGRQCSDHALHQRQRHSPCSGRNRRHPDGQRRRRADAVSGQLRL